MADGTMGGALDQHVFKVNIAYRANNQICQTGFKLRDVAVNDNSAQDVADAVHPFANGLFRGLLLDVDQLLYIDVTRLFSEEGYRREYVNVFGTNAPGATTRLPTFLCCEVALKRAARKRYGQGRMFWPIRQDTWVDSDTLTGPAITAIQSIIDDLMDKFSGVSADLHLCNSHLTLPARPATPTSPARAEIPPHWYDVDVAVLNTQVTMLRSRKVGHGS